MSLDIELIRQKDHIRGLVFDEKYEEAILLLNFVAPLWADCSYAYKTEEIKELIRQEIRHHINEATHWKTEKKFTDLLAVVPK